MKEMKTLTLPNGTTYEIVDDKARKDLSNLESETRRDCVAPIVQTAEGLYIAITDSSDRPVRNLKVFGKTIQSITTGKNLLENTAVTSTINGITYTVNDDGSVLVNGTATASSVLTINPGFTFEKGVDYTLTGCPAGGSIDSYYISDTFGLVDTGEGVIGAVIGSINNVLPIQICIASGVTVNNKVFHPMIRLASNDNDAYEPYTGGITSPNPEYPQELHNVENPTVCITGANLFDASRLSSVSRGGVEITNNGDGTFGISGLGTTTETCSCEYSISHQDMCLLFHPGKLRLVTNVKTYPMVFVNLYKNGSFHSTIMSSTWSRDYAYELPEEYFKNDIYSLRVGLHANANTTIINGIVRPILTQHEGDITEVYKTPQTMAINRTLPGIGDIHDEIDFERGVYIQRTIRRQIMHSDSWAVMEDEGRYWLIEDDFYNISSDAYCTHFYKASTWLSHTLTDGTFIIYRDSSWNDGRMSFKDSRFDNLDKWKQFLENNTVEIIYQLATPIEIPLTKEELAAFNELYTHKTNTTVLNDAGAEMEMEYSQDARMYIRNVVYGDAYDLVDEVVTQDKIQAAVDNWLNARFASAEGVSF